MRVTHLRGRALAGHNLLWSVAAFYSQTEVESEWSNSAACLMPKYRLFGTYLASAVTIQDGLALSARLAA
jgi:hypothetical protein